MAKAKKLPSGNWRVQLFTGYSDEGKRIYESFTAPTEAEANLLANTRKIEIERGIKKNRIPSEMTVAEAIDKYIEDRDSVLAPKTIREYKGYRKNYLHGIMSVRIRDLTDSIVQREINRESRRLSPKSIRNIYGLFVSSVHSAVPDITFNVKLPQKIKKEMNIPTKEQLIKLLEYAEGKRIEIPILLGATCGLRRGEIAALDLNSDVDYDNCKISVTKSVSNNDKSEWVTKTTKTTGSSRVIDCPEWVVEKLKTARDTGYKNMNPAHITSGFAKMCDKLGIDIRFHDLRHYYASLMLSLGVPDKYAMARMGHSTPNMLKNVYQHLMDDKDKEISDTINQFFNDMQHDMQHK